MKLDIIGAGKSPPEDIYVVVEVPRGSAVKYELDKESGAVFVDRFLFTPMTYPCDYGFIPETLAADGDPIDVLVLGQESVAPGTVIRARPIGVLLMEDEAGQDEKIIAVPHSKLTSYYDNVRSHEDIPQSQRDQIKHFFEHYKDLEPDKWVKVRNWSGAEKARELILAALESARK